MTASTDRRRGRAGSCGQRPGGPHHSLADAALLRAARRRGLDVHPRTVNEEAEMRRPTELGVDAIFTDLPDRLLRLLGVC